MTTKHSHAPNFGKHIADCPRCLEIKAGAPTVKGWNAFKKEQDARFIRDLKAHDCIKSHCGPVCTAFDW